MLKNWTISQKLLVINGAFLVPIAVLLTLYVQVINGHIRFAQQERDGLVYQRPLQKLLDLLPVHAAGAGGASAAGGSGGVPAPTGSESDRKTAQIDTAFSQLADTDAKFARSLQTDAAGLAKRKRSNLSVEALQRRWEELKTRGPTPGGLTHATLFADLRALVSHVGDTSNLILDPDLDSYYVMDVTLLAIPDALVRQEEIRSEAVPLLARGIPTPKQRAALHSYAEFLTRADLGRITASLDTAMTEDPNFYGPSPSLSRNVGPALVEATQATEALVALLRRAVNEEKAEVTGDEVAGALSKSRAAYSRLFNAAADELDVLLAARQATYRARRTSALVFAALSLLVWALPIVAIMRSITGPLGNAVVVLSGSSAELTAQALSQSAGATEQAASVAEVTATVEELSRTARQIAETSGKVAQTAEHNLRSAESAHTAVEETVAGMETLKTKVHTLAEKILALGEKAQQISVVVNIINEFAGDTHLLALNASIEAAGAGEHGKRFGVVAAEVKRLAERVVQATSEIRSLIGEVQSATNGAVMSAEDGAREAERGSALAVRSGEAITEILRQVQGTFGLAQEISLATQQQGQASEQVARTMHDVSMVAQQAATSAQQAQAAAEELRGVAERLSVLVGKRAT